MLLTFTKDAGDKGVDAANVKNGPGIHDFFGYRSLTVAPSCQRRCIGITTEATHNITGRVCKDGSAGLITAGLVADLAPIVLVLSALSAIQPEAQAKQVLANQPSWLAPNTVLLIVGMSCSRLALLA